MSRRLYSFLIFLLGIVAQSQVMAMFEDSEQLSSSASGMVISIPDSTYMESATFSSAYRQLEIARKSNVLAKQELKRRIKILEEYKTRKLQQPFTAEEKRAGLFALENAKANRDESNLQLAEARRIAQTTKKRILSLKEEEQAFTLLAHMSDYIAKKLIDLRNQIRLEEDILRLAQARVDVLTESLGLSEQRVRLEKQISQVLSERSQMQDNEAAHRALENEIVVLQRQQEFWIAQAAKQQQLLQVSLAPSRAKKHGKNELVQAQNKQQLELQIFEANERSDLYDQEIAIVRVKHDLSALARRSQQEVSITELRAISRQLDHSAEQILAVSHLLTQKIEFLNRDFTRAGSVISSHIFSRVYADLLYKTKQQLLEIQNLQIRSKQLSNDVNIRTKRAIARRHELPGFNLQEWQQLGSELAFIPTFTWYASEGFLDDLRINITKLHFWEWLDQWVAITFLGAFTYWVQPRLVKVVAQSNYTKTNILKNIGWFTLGYIVRYFAFYMLVIALVLSLVLIGTPWIALWPGVTLATIFFCFSFLLHISRYYLVQNTVNQKGQDVRLYRRVRILLISSALLATITLLVAQLPVSYVLQDLFQRMFMFIILLFGIFLWRSWRVVPNILAQQLHSRYVAIHRIIRLVSFLSPLLLLFAAVIGLVGFVGIAWQVLQHFMVLLVVLAGYLLVRRILTDVLNWIASQLIRTTKNGWFWTEAVLKPAARVLQLSVVVAVAILLFFAYGLNENQWWLNQANWLITHPLFNFAGTDISLESLAILALMLIFFYWATRWMREFSYRWIYTQVEDIGLRNTLAVFSQYGVVLIGFFVTMNWLGIDFESFALLASALAVGIGFGLRNLANDFVCGFLLLIERPVRRGDFVSISGFEGEVLHIGMRAMTIQTWDHMEVIVPNSETFSRSFTNWTHQDSIVRTVFTLRLSREDDPRHIAAIILRTLQGVPDILASPSPEIYFKEVESCLLEFQIGYYISISRQRTRLDVRSQVLFILWDQFKAEGIKPPYPSQEIFIKSLPAEFKKIDSPINPGSS